MPDDPTHPSRDADDGDDLAANLARVSPFGSLDGDDLERLAALCDVVSLDEGERIRQPPGMPKRSLYVVMEGSLAVYRDEVGRATELQGRLGPAEYFGEQGLFGDAEGASALAREPSRLARIAHERLLDWLDGHPEVALRLQMAAARRHTENVAATLDSSGRRDLRIRVDHTAVLELPYDKRLTATLENLSVGGLCLDGIPETWREGMRMAFQMHVAGQAVPVDARVSWRQGTLAGLAFMDVDDAHERRVRRLLRLLREEHEAAARE